MKRKERNQVLETLQDLLIVQLTQIGLDTGSVRRVAGVQMSRVTRISKILKKAQKNRKGSVNG